MSVPTVLMSGDHKAIAEWREEQSKERTEKRRPDLKKKYRQI
jgi:tRNA (guanine37-N1)-methyltransferase